MPEIKQVGFELSISGRDDGTIEAMYIQLSNAKVSATKEIRSDVLLADYAEDGQLVGIEVLAPVRVADVEALIDDRTRESFHRFLKGSAPRELVSA